MQKDDGLTSAYFCVASYAAAFCAPLLEGTRNGCVLRDITAPSLVLSYYIEDPQYKPHLTHNPLTHSDERLALKTFRRNFNPINVFHRYELTCVAGRILVSGALSWRRSRHEKRAAKPRGKIKLTCTHSSRSSAAIIIQHSHANPASYAGYTLAYEYSPLCSRERRLQLNYRNAIMRT